MNQEINILEEGHHKITNQITLEQLLDRCKDPNLKGASKGTKGAFNVSAIFKNNYRKTENIIDYTGLYGFDIDLKDKNYDDIDIINEQIDDFLEYWSMDHIFWKRSASKKGLHLITRAQKANNEIEYKFIWEDISNEILEVFNQLDIDLFNVDKACKDPTRLFYLSYDENADINPLPAELKTYTNFNNKIIVDIDTLNLKVDISKINDKYLKEIFKIKKENGIRYEKLIKFFSNISLSYSDFGNFFMIKSLSINGRRLFFNLYKTYYKQKGGNNINILNALKNFNEWNLFLNKQKNRGVKQKTLKGFFTGSKIQGLDPNYFDIGEDEDFFKQKYNVNLNANRYITEKYDEITNEFIDGINVLKSPAGSGKNTIIKKYIENEYKDKNILFLSLKTPLLDQQYIQYTGTTFNLHKNYNQIPTKLSDETNNIIFSTIHSFNKLIDIDFDLIIFDEAHLLIDYSSIKDFQHNFRELLSLMNFNKKQIYLSATPEKFILSLYKLNYKYINIEINNYKKTNINLEYTNNIKSKLYELLDKHENQNNVVYLNDKKAGNTINTNKIKNGILINADTKNDREFMKIINNQIITTAITYIATSIISEGLNINNTDEFNLFIVNNHTTFIENIYQFINRFRERKVNVYYISSAPFEKDGYEELFDFNIDAEFYELEMILNFLNKNKNYDSKFEDIRKYLIKDKYINRFLIINNKYREFIKHLKYNPPYFEHYMKYFFNIIDKNYIKNEGGFRFNNNSKVDLFFKSGYIEYGMIWSHLINNDIEASDISKDTLKVVNIKPTDEKLKLIRTFYNKYIFLIKRIEEQKKKIIFINKIFKDLNLDEVNIDDYIYLSSIQFKSEYDKLILKQIQNTNNIKLSETDEIIKQEMINIKDWINLNIQKTNKYKYIQTELLKDFMLKNNKIVKGKPWINKIADYINGEIKQIRVNKNKLYVVKIKSLVSAK